MAPTGERKYKSLWIILADFHDDDDDDDDDDGTTKDDVHRVAPDEREPRREAYIQIDWVSCAKAGRPA